jgi:hypothetical protein
MSFVEDTVIGLWEALTGATASTPSTSERYRKKALRREAEKERKLAERTNWPNGRLRSPQQ